MKTYDDEDYTDFKVVLSYAAVIGAVWAIAASMVFGVVKQAEIDEAAAHDRMHQQVRHRGQDNTLALLTAFAPVSSSGGDQ